MMKNIKFAPDSGSQCPECAGNGLVETQEFGAGHMREIHAWCGGLTGEKEDGCGWEQIYRPVLAAPQEKQP